MANLDELRHVRRVKDPIKDGSIVAAEFAWNRKYVVTMFGDEIWLNKLGDIHADGRPIRRPRRAKGFQVRYARDYNNDTAQLHLLVSVKNEWVHQLYFHVVPV